MKKLRIYLVNIWDELLSVRGLNILEEKFVVGGNWLGKKRRSNLNTFQPELIIYAPSRDYRGLNLSEDVLRGIPTITWVLFPDHLIGWDFKMNKFKNRLSYKTTKQFRLSHILLTNSFYTKTLLEKATAGQFKFINCYLGIDLLGILKTKQNCSMEKQAMPYKLNVLWNHMWRVDKNFQGALKIFKSLALKHPNVGFFIGRKESWGDCQYSPPWLKKEYLHFLHWLKKEKAKNILFVRTFPQEEYWKFISMMDISFSVSFHESFGVSVLEQAAAGLACILPKGLVYNEIFRDYDGLVNRKDIQSALENTIFNKRQRLELQKSALNRARFFDVGKTINELERIIKEI